MHTASEVVYNQLVLLESDVSYKLGKNGKRAELPPPPVDVLRQLHPLFFAEPLVHAAASNAENEQKRQLGTFMVVVSWLLRLLGKAELSGAVEALLEAVPAPGGLGRHGSANGRAPQPPPIKRQGSEKGSQRSRISRWGATADVPGSPAAPSTPPHGQPRASSGSAGSGGGRASSGLCMVPSCTNLLKGAEAVKHAAQAMGMSTEFSPVNAVATGHGRAVCAILQDMLDAAWQLLQPTPKKPRYHEPEALAGEEAAAAGGGDEAAGVSDDESALIEAHHPVPFFRSAPGEDDDEPYLLPEPEPSRAAGPAAGDPASRGRGSGGAGTSGRGSGPGRPEAQPSERGPVPAQQVDPVAWRQEADRVGPALSRIVMPAGANGEVWGEWQRRIQVLKESAAAMQREGPSAAVALAKAGGSVASDLERIEVTERRVNGGAEPLVRAYRAARGQLSESQRRVMQQEELQQAGNSAMAELNGRLDEVQLEMQDRAGQLDGGKKIQAAQAAMRRLMDEMREMDVRIGVLQHELLSKQRKHMVQGHRALADSDGDDDDAG